MSNEKTAKFHVGQLIRHRLFAYRGVVYDVDANFSGDNAWYDAVARSRPPKDEPWYHVLVDNAEHTTYVAERNLEADDSKQAIRHPLLDTLFRQLDDAAYAPRETIN